MFTSNFAAQIECDAFDDDAEDAVERASMLRTSILFQREYRKKRYASGRSIRGRAVDLAGVEAI